MTITGETFQYRSQKFWIEGTQDYERRDGQLTKLLALYTECPSCGAGFRMMATATTIGARKLRRRCDACKRQGLPVERRSPLKSSRKRSKGPAKRSPLSDRPFAPVATQRPPWLAKSNAGPDSIALRLEAILRRSLAASPSLLVAAVEKAAADAKAARASRSALGMLDDMVTPAPPPSLPTGGPGE